MKTVLAGIGVVALLALMAAGLLYLAVWRAGGGD